MVKNRRRKVAILGSTGSIGTQALDVVARHAQRFEVVGLAAGSRVRALVDQAKRFSPRVVSCARRENEAFLRAALPDTRTAWGSEGLFTVAAQSDADVVLAATDGTVALEAVFAAVERGLTVAVANKEIVVAAGELLFAAARASGAAILPVDSEHSALFQCLVGEPRERIALLVLTASGGPFWDLDTAQMRNARLTDALRHPTWNMGTKNTVDSATMMNKGLEVIEASRFFGVSADRIAVLVHRTSIAHGFAIFTDGSIKGQFGVPDMRVPIGYALAHPDRLVNEGDVDPFVALGGHGSDGATTLAFERPDMRRFPCLALAYEALRRGGTAPAALSAANEVAVRAFVAGRLAFGDIAEVLASVMQAPPAEPLTIAGVRAADQRSRAMAERAIAETNSSAGVV